MLSVALPRLAQLVFQSAEGLGVADTAPVPRDSVDLVIACDALDAGFAPHDYQLLLVGPAAEAVLLFGVGGSPDPSVALPREQLVVPGGWRLRAVTTNNATIRYLAWRVRSPAAPLRDSAGSAA